MSIKRVEIESTINTVFKLCRAATPVGALRACVYTPVHFEGNRKVELQNSPKDGDTWPRQRALKRLSTSLVWVLPAGNSVVPTEQISCHVSRIHPSSYAFVWTSTQFEPVRGGE
uniref:Uncharacterized protein n=1 Tax=Odontella aurita TaxID=265563 RepID=A0A7S4MK60_9STRA